MLTRIGERGNKKALHEILGKEPVASVEEGAGHNEFHLNHAAARICEDIEKAKIAELLPRWAKPHYKAGLLDVLVRLNQMKPTEEAGLLGGLQRPAHCSKQ